MSTTSERWVMARKILYRDRRTAQAKVESLRLLGWKGNIETMGAGAGQSFIVRSFVKQTLVKHPAVGVGEEE